MRRPILCLLILLLTVPGFFPSAFFGTAEAKQRLAFGGGPVGGTFQYFANGIASYVTDHVEGTDMSAEGTGGSAANLKLLHNGDIDFGIVYSGDLFLGRMGKLPQDDRKYDRVRAVAYLYGAPAQLVVLKKSGILSARDLAGKRVAVGNAGSGAALSAERFFRQLGIWDGVNRQFLGYSAASSAFLDRKIDAFWVLVGYPNSSILQTAAQDDVDLVNLADEAEETGFFEAYPFYSPVTIPAKTYTGVDSAIRTFQDSAIWAVRSGLDSETVYRILKTVFSPEGLNHLRLATQTAESMSVQDGLQGIRTPLAQGAAKFWEENGLPIPPSLRPAE